MADAMKLVPVEPTDDMMACAEQASQMLEWQIRASWSAMLAASPPAREEAPVEGAGTMAVDAWLNEKDGRGIRLHRLVEDLESGADIIPWLRAAYALRARTSEPAREGDLRPETTSEHIARDMRDGIFPQQSQPRMVLAHPAPATADKLRVAMKTACDLLAERTYGNAARSPGHNARLVLEAALNPEAGR